MNATPLRMRRRTLVAAVLLGKVTIEGNNLDFDEIQEIIESLGGTIHSIDEVVAGKKIIRAEAGAAGEGYAELVHPRELRPLEEIEREYLRHALAVHQGDRRSLARRLGLSERSLYRRLRELDRDD